MNEGKVFQTKLMDLRSAANLPQQALADALKVSRTTISKWETGSQEPSLGDLKSIADYFKVPVAYLFGEEDSIEQKIIVIDTSIFINRPTILEKVKSIFDSVVIPTTVISELNFQKDNGQPNVRQKAWLAMMSINKHATPPTNITVDGSLYPGKNNDEKIVASAIRNAKASSNNKVFMFSNDILFKFLVQNYPNIEALTPNEFDVRFPEQSDFDAFLTQEFMSAVQARNAKGVQTMVDCNLEKIDVNKVDVGTGYTPLITAIRNRDYRMMETLLQIPSLNVNACDNTKYNFTPLLHTCQTKDMKAFEMLVAAGADMNAFGKGVNFGNTPLMVCAWGYFNDGLKYLTQFDISYNQQDNNGFTALHKACIKTNIKAVEILIDKIDSRIIDHKGKRAYDYLNASDANAKIIMQMFTDRDLVKRNG